MRPLGRLTENIDAALLAQAQPKAVDQQAVVSVVVWVGVLIGVVIVAGLIVIAMRRRLHRDDRAGSAGLFEEMRHLHAEGKLSDEEFARVKERMSRRMRDELHTGDRS